MDVLPRKRTRYCPHCDEDVTYLVYKKHKEEFYDPIKKVWRCNSDDFEKLDAEDEDIISRAVSRVDAGYFIICIVRKLQNNMSIYFVKFISTKFVSMTQDSM